MAEDDETLADASGSNMRKFADICVRNAADQGFLLNYKQTSLAVLDDMVDALWGSSKPSDEAVEAVAFVLGSYVGEVIRIELGAEWVHNAEHETIALKLGGVWLFPHAKAAKRLLNGRGDNFEFFFEAAKDLWATEWQPTDQR